jgi:hypothetical protein
VHLALELWELILDINSNHQVLKKQALGPVFFVVYKKEIMLM